MHGRRYEIVKYLDEGGMQEVYVARDTVLEREVALKVPKSQSASRRFHRSAVTAARVNHPNVARTLDYFDEGGMFYLIEELIVGKDLQQIRALIPAFDPDLCAMVFHHFAKGLAASHHEGVVHRDLKPSNIMVVGGTGFSGLKVTDFGIAKMAEAEFGDVDPDNETTITGSQTVFGALPYLSPEMINAPKEVGTASDVWSMGAIVYTLMSGEHPFGRGLGAVNRIINDPLPTIPKLANKAQFKPLVEVLFPVVLSCFERDPANRPTADNVVSELDAICYADSDRSVGIVENYIGQKAFGFITARSGKSFFHRDSVYGVLPKTGGKVLFTSFAGSPHPRAHPVLAVKKKTKTK